MIGANVDRAVTCLVFDQSSVRTMDVHDVSSHQFPDVGYWRRPMHCELMCGGARAATRRHSEEVELTTSCEDVMI